MKLLNKKNVTALGLSAYTLLFNVQMVLADDKGAEVQKKLNDAGNVVKGILTGLVVLVGICVALFIIIKRMPDADDPREKSEVYKAIGRVAGLVALAAAIIWLLPFVYGLFT